MAKDRPPLGFGDELESLGPDAFPAPRKASRSVRAEFVRAAEKTGFKSREVQPAEPRPPQRRRRTGRNVQFNLKLKAETIETFTRIADREGWGLGEAFERAVALLERENTSR